MNTGEFQELFYQDPYLVEFDATVLSCEASKKGWEIALDQTAFYPKGGGQNADHGTLGEAVVTDVKRKDGVILHTADREISVGTHVHGVIDWERRFDHMQNHSGEHILSGIIHRRFGYENVGFHMSDVITIDFNGPLSWDELMKAEEKANEVVWSDIPIETLYPDDSELGQLDYRSKKELTGQVRLISIEGADLCACCGTHVAKTGEVGMIKCLSLIHYKGGVRIEMVCGKKALLDYQKKTDLNIHISQALSAKPKETDTAVKRLIEESEALKLEKAAVMNRYFQAKASQFSQKAPLLVTVEEDLSTNDIRRFCELLLAKDKGSVCAVLCRKPGEEAYQYVIGTREELDLRPKAKELNAALYGRGGGQAAMIQGLFCAPEETIRETLSQAFAPEA